MAKKKQAHNLMNNATDTAARDLNGVPHQKSDSVTAEFNASIDKASELASAKYSEKTK